MIMVPLDAPTGGVADSGFCSLYDVAIYIHLLFLFFFRSSPPLIVSLVAPSRDLQRDQDHTSQ